MGQLPNVPKLSLKSQSVVVAHGKLVTGEEITQEIPLTHDPGAPVTYLIAQAFRLIVQTGGIVCDVPGNEKMKFYASGAFPNGIEFEVKKVQLVQPSISL
jgi:hypothetical protein